MKAFQMIQTRLHLNSAEKERKVSKLQTDTAARYKSKARKTIKKRELSLGFEISRQKEILKCSHTAFSLLSYPKINFYTSYKENIISRLYMKALVTL